MYVSKIECDDTNSPSRILRPISDDTSNFAYLLEGVRSEFSLVIMNLLHAHPLEVVYGCAEADGSCSVWGTCLKLVWDIFPRCLMSVDFSNHFTATQEWWRIFKDLLLTVEYADACGAEHLMP